MLPNPNEELLLPEKLEVPAEPTERLLPATNVGVVPDTDAGELLEANWAEVLLLLRPKEGRLDELKELEEVKPNKLPEAPEAIADRVDPNKGGLVFPHKDADSTELEREAELAELPNTNAPEVVAVAELDTCPKRDPAKED